MSRQIPFRPARRHAGPPPFLIAAALAVAALLAASGCSDRMHLNPLDNQAPQVSLDPVRPPDKSPEGAVHLVEWRGGDVDGRVDHYRVAVNPRTLEDDDPAWISTADRRRSVTAPRRATLGAATRDRAGALERTDGRDFDLIAVEAVDDQGAVSLPAVRAFFEDNVAPTVTITSPRPSALINATVPPTVTIRFIGSDPDGPTGEPVSFKYILLGPGSEFPIPIAVANPDSLRRYYAPDFDGWASVANIPGKGGQVTLSDLVLGANYLFAVVAFDNQGAYSPMFSLNSNMLRFRVAPANIIGPLIEVSTDVLNYRPPSGGLPGPAVDLEYPSGVPLSIRWSATPDFGASNLEYRWVLDPYDLEQEFKRPRAGNDLHHWRPWSPDLKSATVGPFHGGETHEFVIEARDDLGRSRLTVRIHARDRTYSSDLLIVDDTRLLPDQLVAGGACTRPPIGTWPTAAELDTFLYAIGNTPWRCYPSGTITPPGLFSGYAYDTVGTRTGSDDLTVPLEVLNRYRHVVWIVDPRSAVSTRPGSDPAQPMSALRYMSAPGRFNTLAAYVRGGGQVWLVGGGGAFASTIPWNMTSNDGGGITFSNAQGELMPGRFMFDFPHWQSEFKVATAGGFVRRSPGTNASALPTEIRNKTAATDPFPPNRGGQPANLFYKTTVDVEFLSLPNAVAEGGVSALDSLYRFDTFQLPPSASQRICMTLYHGVENPPFVFTGFDIWSFARADCQSLVDFVLGDVWGLPKSAAAQVLVNAAPR